MQITQKDVEKIAELAKMELSAEEVQNFTQALQETLVQMDVLKQVETEHIEPTVDVLPLKNVFHEDEVEEGLTKEQVFANASDVENNCFKVPRII
ncbi:MAG: Asp-tRNA(Asn)/Glu-tRNA(Gln) amidotransferase subunit GatC [Clostridia bacterium]|jgi:aspartyl-tRNA(Asn)/glutamyl-tRNA(Gln) amidotransferase subunit C|nr:Asp-tRNA(Asn)/Glu-tRNA(Gln) amidotransferase subunit GatC [Clostridia bacterium]